MTAAALFPATARVVALPSLRRPILETFRPAREMRSARSVSEFRKQCDSRRRSHPASVHEAWTLYAARLEHFIEQSAMNQEKRLAVAWPTPVPGARRLMCRFLAPATPAKFQDSPGRT